MCTMWMPGLMAAALAAMAQPPAPAPIASNRVIEIRGKIVTVRTVPGQGMPFIEIETGSSRITLRLSSLRYLMSRNFNPKVGQEVFAKAYQISEHEAIAITVRLTAHGREIRLRDANGWPVWARYSGR